MVEFLLNHKQVKHDLSEGVILLDLLRTRQKLTGTKQACREGDCGACMVLSGQLSKGVMHYQPVNSCLLPLGLCHARHIVSIEGVNGDELNRVQQALVEQGAIQCGFCSSGLVMAIMGFLLNAPEASYTLALDAISGNLCRCTGYAGIKRALKQICKRVDLKPSSPVVRVADLVSWGILPRYFADVPQRLAELPQQVNSVEKVVVKVAGGTDLFVQQAEQLAATPWSLIKQAEGICVEQQQCRIAVATHIETLRNSVQLQALYPQIVDDFKLIGSTSIRQQATIGGNFVNASPIGDLSVLFLALDAELTIATATNQRTIPLRNFFKAYKKVDLQADELLIQLTFQFYSTPMRISFEKVSKRSHLDIASVNSAMCIELQGQVFKRIHIVAGGVAAIPLYLQKTCHFLQGKIIEPELLKHALELVQTEIAPFSDIRGSADYKRLLLKQLLIAHWLKLLPEYVSWKDFQ